MDSYPLSLTIASSTDTFWLGWYSLWIAFYDSLQEQTYFKELGIWFRSPPETKFSLLFRWRYWFSLLNLSLQITRFTNGELDPSTSTILFLDAHWCRRKHANQRMLEFPQSLFCTTSCVQFALYGLLCIVVCFQHKFCKWLFLPKKAERVHLAIAGNNACCSNSRCERHKIHPGVSFWLHPIASIFLIPHLIGESPQATSKRQ